MYAKKLLVSCVLVEGENLRNLSYLSVHQTLRDEADAVIGSYLIFKFQKYLLNILISGKVAGFVFYVRTNETVSFSEPTCILYKGGSWI